MHIHIVTIFPGMFAPALDSGVLGRAVRGGLVAVDVHDPRSYTHDRHRSVDDSAFGGGPGMVMMAPPIFAAVEALGLPPGSPVALMSPQGRRFDQACAERLAKEAVVTLICGRYEGVDERVIEHLATEELSVGDYVLSGGEPAALVITDAVVRLLPGVLGHGEEARADDTHTSGLVQHAQYTRPAEYRGWAVPEVLTSGDHAAIDRWRRADSLQRTLQRRPDLLAAADLSEKENAVLRDQGWEPEVDR
jgi:tRNA (guanine37-N1)-methyltransferase